MNMRQRRAIQAHNAMQQESRKRVLQSARQLREAEHAVRRPPSYGASDIAMDAVIVLAVLVCIALAGIVLAAWVYP